MERNSHSSHQTFQDITSISRQKDEKKGQEEPGKVMNAFEESWQGNSNFLLNGKLGLWRT